MELAPRDPFVSICDRYDVSRRAVSTSAGAAAGQLLMHAAQQGDAVTCQSLIVECGANTSFRNGLGESCLHVAAHRGNVTVLELLLRYGADPNVVTEHRFGGRTPLHVAARTGNTKVVGCLLDLHADPNIPDALSKLPLHDAAAVGDEAIVRMLLSKGSIPSAPDKMQFTPHDYAVAGGFHGVAAAINAAVSARAAASESGEDRVPTDLLTALTSMSAFSAARDAQSKRIVWREVKPPSRKK